MHLNGLSNMDESNLTWLWHPLIHDQRWNSTIVDFWWMKFHLCEIVMDIIGLKFWVVVNLWIALSFGWMGHGKSIWVTSIHHNSFCSWKFIIIETKLQSYCNWQIIYLN
jgi:hypothetical protein